MPETHSLLWFAEQIFNGLDTGMIRMETPADELKRVLDSGREAIARQKGSAGREWFAGQALMGMLADSESHFKKGTPSAEIAMAAYDLADAMIAARDA